MEGDRVGTVLFADRTSHQIGDGGFDQTHGLFNCTLSAKNSETVYGVDLGRLDGRVALFHNSLYCGSFLAYHQSDQVRRKKKVNTILLSVGGHKCLGVNFVVKLV